MKYVQLGSTGLRVSQVCLGCLSYGDREGAGPSWVLGESDASVYLHQALDAGINFFDTADRYGRGESERILGNVLIPAQRRENLVISSKVGLPMSDDPNGKGLSRKHIMESIDGTLKRLKTDYVDIYYMHRLDEATPLEETLQALNDLVRTGKVLYLGCSSVWTWQFVQMRELQRRNGWAQFVAMQNLYNLCYREEEREMIPYCLNSGVALLPWSPLARGFLAGHRARTDGDLERDKAEKESLNMFGSEQDLAILDQVEKVAEKLGVLPAQVSLAWTLAKGVTAPIIGATKAHHISTAVEALEVELDKESIRMLEGPYRPRAVMW